MPAEGPASGKRGKVVAVRLYPAEWEAWSAAAAAEGRAEVGRWVRERVQDSLSGSDAQGPSRAEHVAAVLAARAQLARIGNNLNQAMRYANATAGGPGAAEAGAQLAGVVAEAAAAMRSVRDGLMIE